MQVSTITPKHLETLAGSAISPEAADAWGIWSITDDSDLPEDLDEYRSTTGICFPLRQLDGTVIHQVRLDHPLGDTKYFQPRGTGAILNVPAMMAPRVGKVTKLWVVEGTKQTIAACLYAPDDVLIVGIQGCANFSANGVPLEEISDLTRGITDAVIFFDADWTHNPNVWQAASNLRAHLDVVCGVANVRIADLGTSGTAGLDDRLGSQSDPTERPAILERLVDKAKDKLGRKPAAKRKAGESLINRMQAPVRVDWDAAETIREVPPAEPGGAPKREVVMPAAARIVAIESEIDEDEESSSAVLTLEVALPKVGESGNTRTRRFQVRTPSSRLAFVGEWLDRLPAGEGVTVPRETRPNDEVANAIRSSPAPDCTFVSVLPRLGWYLDRDAIEVEDGQDDAPARDVTGVWRWCDGRGATGAHDRVTHLRGRPSAQDFQSISLPDVSTMSAETARETVRRFINTRLLLRKETRGAWDIAIAAWALSFTGLTPNAALGYFGPPSSGKSTIAQGLASTLSTAWAPRAGTPMATFNASVAGMDLLANGMSHVFLHVDDLKPESSDQAMKTALKAMDALLRRSHGSGGAVRGGLNRQSDSLIVRGVDASAPLVIITGEQVPTGGDFAESGLDRVLIIPVEKNSLFGPGQKGSDNLGEFERRARDGDFLKVTPLYLRYLAAAIDQGEGPAADRLTKFVTELDDARREQSSFAEEQGVVSVNSSDRARLLTGSLVTGMQMLVQQFAVHLGALTAEEAAEIMSEFTVELAAAVDEHTATVMGGNTKDGDRALARLRSAVASRTVTISRDDASHKPLIGEVKDVIGPDGTQVRAVAINVASAAAVLAWPGGHLAMTRALRDMAVTDASGKTTRTLTINNTRVQVVCISLDVWGEPEAEKASDF